MLCYRLTANPRAPNQLHALRHSLWTSLTKQGGISSRISSKDRYQSKNGLGLNLRDLEPPIHKFTLCNALQSVENEGPPLPCAVMKSVYLAHDPNWILDTFWDSCNSLGYEYNGLPRNPRHPSRLSVGDHLFGQCLKCDYSQPPPPRALQHPPLKLKPLPTATWVKSLRWTSPKWKLLSPMALSPSLQNTLCRGLTPPRVFSNGTPLNPTSFPAPPRAPRTIALGTTPSTQFLPRRQLSVG